MSLQELLKDQVKEAIRVAFQTELDVLEFQPTRKDFEGDITLVLFPLVKILRVNPAEIGAAIGAKLVHQNGLVSHYNIVSGFLNLIISDSYYVKRFNTVRKLPLLEKIANQQQAVMVEFSSPNTNKPLHLGHVRNILLGDAVASILEATGKKVYRTQIINDRGIHICKSMVAWRLFGNGETPDTANIKGDKLVGKYYVAFDLAYKQQIEQLVAEGFTTDDAKRKAPIMLEAQKMLLDWEAGNPEVLKLWHLMNQWVYSGFEETYKNIGVSFDKNYYESNTYLLGKNVVEEGLKKGIFEKDADGSVWIDLSAEGLDRKIVLRADGTAVYITQDIGTAIQRATDYPDVGEMVYTVGNEQDYHFKVLFLMMKKLGYNWANNLYHLSYGMVDLPSGKMKSREGTVVDADELLQEMTQTAQRISDELGKLEGYTTADKNRLYHTIGLGALKYYILKVDPKKRILFNPEESVDFSGNTGPFIQYTYTRIQSLIRKAGVLPEEEAAVTVLHEKEKELLKLLFDYPEVVSTAAAQLSPAVVANYTYDLVKEYNSFYQSVSVLAEPQVAVRNFRIQLSKRVGDTISDAFKLLGIGVPERM